MSKTTKNAFDWLQLQKSSKNPLRTQSAFMCSKLTIETLEKGVKYVHS